MEDAACTVVASKRRERDMEEGEIIVRPALINSAVRSELKPRGKRVVSRELGPDDKHRSLADKLDFSGR
jgi:hypothetical protein